MSAVSSTFKAHRSVDSEERAISLSWKLLLLLLLLLYQPRLARNQFQVRNSVRPMRLFGHNLDHITTSNSPVKESGIPNQLLDVQLHTIAISGLSRVRTELIQGNMGFMDHETDGRVRA